MPASTTALTVVGPTSTPAGAAIDEQQSTAAGNSFPNAGDVLLLVRNDHASARTITFSADRYGVERTVLTVSIPGSGTEHGLALLGPFPPALFNDHNTTDATKTGHVMLTHSGSNADLMLCPIQLNRGLL